LIITISIAPQTFAWILGALTIAVGPPTPPSNAALETTVSLAQR